jgi:cysteine-S-conjugate beta-lyase
MRDGFEDLDLAELRRRRSAKWRAYPPGVLPAFIAEMDYDLAAPVLDALRSALEHNDCGYANAAGLSEAFVSFAAARHSWQVAPDRVHLIPDVISGFDAVLRAVTEPGDGVVINPPVYPPFFEHIRVGGRTVVEVPLLREAAGWSLDFDELAAAFAAGARCYLLCNPHNPTGRVFSAGDLRRIASLAVQYGVTVVSDEIHAPLTLAGAWHTPFVAASPEAAACGVTLASASKAFNIAGLKCAVAVADSDEMQRTLLGLPPSIGYGAGLLGVLASEAAWLHGGPWLDALLEQLYAMRSLFGSLLAAQVPRARYIPPEAGYLAWVDCSWLGPEPAAAILAKGQLALGRGLDFGASGEGFVRVTIGTSSALLGSIVSRLATGAMGVRAVTAAG